MTPNPNPSPELREERSAWLRDRLLYAIQFHMWADATAAEVEEVIESLSDSDEYDPNVAALVQMPKWCSPCEAQQGVDAFFASPQTLPAPGEVDYAEAARVMFEACPDRFMRAEQCYPAIDALAAAGFFATVAAANDEGVAKLRQTLVGLELTEDGYSLRVAYDGDAADDGRAIVVGGETVVTFTDSDEGEAVREAILKIMGKSA